MKRWRILTCVLAMVSVGCASANIFAPIGTQLANPLTIAINSTTNRAYVINSNNTILYQTGSVQVFNIVTPTVPVLVSSAQMLSFSGQIYLDTVNQFLYTPNRYAANTLTTTDQVIQVNINEASPTFMAQTNFTSGANSFGIACCDPNSRFLVASQGGEVDAYTPVASPVLTATNLSTTTDAGVVITNPNVDQIAISGTQAFVTSQSGNMLILNLTKLIAGVNPVDYVVTGISNPRAVASDGTNIYVSDVETPNGTTTPILLVLSLASLPTAPANNAPTVTVPVASLQTGAVTQIALGNNTATTNPQQIQLTTSYIAVSCMGDDLITLINRPALTINSNIAVGDQPYGMALYSPGAVDTNLFVVNSQANSISIIDLTTLTVTGTYNSPSS